jgi:Zn finger protein HypA/HybF involved in hydrogenase expression
MGHKVTTETFIEKARAKHGDRYDYSKVVYVRSSAKVTIVCKVHGEFFQRANCHLNGKGCSQCGSNNPLTQKTFIEKSTAMHKGVYDYSLVDFIERTQKVKIICKVHGVFLQTPTAHLRECGCPECGVDAKRINTETFIDRAKNVHGDRFDYSLVEYVNSYSKVQIICKKTWCVFTNT